MRRGELTWSISPQSADLEGPETERDDTAVDAHLGDRDRSARGHEPTITRDGTAGRFCPLPTGKATGTPVVPLKRRHAPPSIGVINRSDGTTAANAIPVRTAATRTGPRSPWPDRVAAPIAGPAAAPMLSATVA